MTNVIVIKKLQKQSWFNDFKLNPKAVMMMLLVNKFDLLLQLPLSTLQFFSQGLKLQRTPYEMVNVRMGSTVLCFAPVDHLENPITVLTLLQPSSDIEISINMWQLTKMWHSHDAEIYSQEKAKWGANKSRGRKASHLESIIDLDIKGISWGSLNFCGCQALRLIYLVSTLAFLGKYSWSGRLKIK